jgi:hypothetical protein
MIGRLLLSFTLALSLESPARAEDTFQRFRSVLIDYFGEQGFVPVLVDRGYQTGDVINIDGINLYARASRCFPGLRPPKSVKTSLPETVHTDVAGMSFGLKLKQLFDSSAGADLTHRVEIKFTDVSDVSVALLDLRETLDRSSCPEIAPLIDGTLGPPKPDQHPFFVVSEVLTGKRQARIQFAAHADLDLKTKQIIEQAADANLSVKGMSDGFVLLASEVVAPIALKPVTVPRVVTIASFDGGLRGSENQKSLQWQPIGCSSADGCWNEFAPFAEQIKAAPATLAPAELYR